MWSVSWTGRKGMLEFAKGLFDIFRHWKGDGMLNISPLQTNSDILFTLSINFYGLIFPKIFQ